MTTKINRFRSPFPAPPTVQPGNMRIIIDVDPLRGSSMRTEGAMTPMLVLDTLLQQFHTFWGMAWKQLANNIVSPNGMPLSKVPKITDDCTGFDATDDNPEICRYCGGHVGNHPKAPVPEVPKEVQGEGEFLR